MQLSLAFEGGPMRFCVLGSGSSGNAIVVTAGREALLVDAGFSCRELEKRLDYVGVAPATVSGLVLTHEHGDHTRGAARFSRRFRVAVHATAGTLERIRLPKFAPPPIVVEAGRRVAIGCFSVRPFAVSHDAREPIGMVVEDQAGCRLGLAADLGVHDGEAWDLLADVDACVLETNHDLEMLMKGPYPWHLKRRIAGESGHLSNTDAANSVRHLAGERWRWLVLYHLSRINNRPVLAESAVREALAQCGSRAEICVSDQFAPTPWMEVEPLTVRLRAAGG